MHHIGDIGFDAVPELKPLPPPDIDPSDNECQEEWLAIATHRQQLIRLGVDLRAVELEDAISAYPDRVEGAVLTFMEKFTRAESLRYSETDSIDSSGCSARPSNPVHNMPRHPVYTAKDFEAPLMPPRAAPRFFPDIMPSRQLGLFMAHREIFNTRLGIMSGFVVTPPAAWKNSKPNLIWVESGRCRFDAWSNITLNGS